ncbi:MAG: alpha/beta hydrolase [Chloroflexi bacterium]|nr:alpha/beta hydrolase [Chloroflexota bacterium]MDA1147029.1 alpha/beta hydrolase [Chloroflexota bacterium]
MTSEADLGPPDYALLDSAGLAASMFYPRPDDQPPPPGASDHLIEVAPGVVLGARFYPLRPDAPTLLYFHGNGEVASDHDNIAPLYHEIGVNLFVAEFRGYGQSTGTPNVAALVGDAHPTVAYFHDLLDRGGYSAARFVMGRSLGAHPALEVAANAAGRFRGLILESGAGNIRRTVERRGLGDTELGARLAAAHDAKVRGIAIPVLLIHGEIDNLVPLSTAEAIRDLLTSTTAQLEVIPRAGHNDLLWVGRDQYFGAISAFVGANG